MPKRFNRKSVIFSCPKTRRCNTSKIPTNSEEQHGSMFLTTSLHHFPRLSTTISTVNLVVTGLPANASSVNTQFMVARIEIPDPTPTRTLKLPETRVKKKPSGKFLIAIYMARLE
ncbi:hypothetical protein TVAG_017740 [Trichomonas vaginalis G3]|uniref:Uncharacterized protein n=1 Tax=Trichomonas vaginalis (strain ATCC PRA-98 / G3) TaxID=412133 RepID=A2GD85_TRIV3|nr:hypothetical protein TVAGG3_0112540 [Trichomonas vaginalis G3]EAX84882.1 hypothetical protein TVAG_017740 [Trichomonas vaginalis G3]KAI5545017.1 hypothetical protein TVAGG3_0112540 [Trichomonas vaginalis G3]|eukprot:XP_001297812.1 hypothetical protein [Trichomonas vaginalis G3]